MEHRPLTDFNLAAFLGLALLFSSISPVFAEPDARWSVRAHGLWFSPAGDETTSVRSVAPSIEERTTHSVTDDGTGFGLSVRYRATPRISIELGAFLVDVDNHFQLDTGDAVLSDVESMGIETYLLGVDWHFTSLRRADLRLGVFLGQTMFDDVIFLTEAGRREKLTFDDDHGVGLTIGIDVPFRQGSPWFLSADARYLVTIMESEVAGQDLDLDPVIVSVGVGFRF